MCLYTQPAILTGGLGSRPWHRRNLGGALRYFGSKVSTLPALTDLITSVVPVGTLCDPFGGVGVVGSHFRSLGFHVHTGDALEFAYHFQVVKIALNKDPDFRGLISEGLRGPQAVIDHLDGMPGTTGWLTKHFAKQRGFFSLPNARRADSVRRQIARWKREGLLTHNEHAYLSAAFINSLDKVANTAGTYYAHLKELTTRAEKYFRFQALTVEKGPRGVAARQDAEELACSRSWDVLYLDPPYNERSYAGYYHLPELLARGLRPKPRGLSGITSLAGNRSDFNSPARSLEALSRLLRSTHFRLLVLHYTDAGLMQPKDLRSLLRRHGDVTEETIEAIGYRTTSGSRLVQHRVYSVTR
jgi:adenine-specific DNA-methyltransferase